MPKEIELAPNADIETSTDSLMTMYTFQDLIAEISRLRMSARTDKASWASLQEVAESFARDESTQSFDVLGDKPWSLLQISIHGHMGVLNSDPLIIDFDPRPGITVLHGANGSGKSSISDAIETVLFKREPLQNPPTAGATQIWESIPIGRNFDSTNIMLTLLSNTQKKLVLTCSLTPEGKLNKFESILKGSDGVNIPIEIGDSWDDALRNHRPIFAYAALERKIQTAKELANYFEDLLALGGCFIALERAIDAQSAEADLAAKKWKSGRTAAFSALAGIDARRSTGDSSDPRPVSEPELSDEIAKWLKANSLVESGELEQEIPREAISRLLSQAEALLEACKQLNALSKLTREKLAAPLKSLLTEARGLKVSDEECPVCLAQGVDWLATLTDTVAEFRKFDANFKVTKDALKTFKMEVDNSLSPVLAIQLGNETQRGLIASRSDCANLVSHFESAFNAGGLNLHQAVLIHAQNLASWILSSEATALIEHAIGQTDRLRQWRLERNQAVEAFVKTWRETQELAKGATLWHATKKRVTDLRVALRAKRTMTLQSKVGQRVNYLLNDCGLSIREINVQTTKASLTLNDQQGNALKLGMLSAGQRNAILLAPLLATIGAGPFSFLILDDPVHAFDDLRIDRLAHVLTELSANQRVVIFTHDERLRQHLLAGSDKCETRWVSRDAATGAVRIEQSSQLWKQLLLDAKTILDMGRPVATTMMSVTDTVRGLCRQSVDNALADFVTLNAILNGRDYKLDVAAIENALTTADRFDIAEGLFEESTNIVNPVDGARALCQPFLLGWNQASHGNPEESQVTDDEIQAAQQAGALLTGISV